MELPYVASWTEAGDAYMAAQESVAVALTAMLWHRPIKPRIATVTLLVAIWMATLAPLVPDWWTRLGGWFPPIDGRLQLLEATAALATVAMFLARPRWLAYLAVAGELSLMWIGDRVIDSDYELCALHVAWFGALAGAYWAVAYASDRPKEPIAVRARSYWKQDLVLFGVASTLAFLVGWLVVQHVCDSADEWGYNYQALVLARFKAYAPVPQCPVAHQAHWTFYWQGRAFSMYLPGWAYFLAPFARLRIPWAASPLCFGAMIVGIARVARRAAGPAGGWIAAACAGLGSASLLNGGARYCHVWVTMLAVWVIESVLASSELGISRRAQWLWGVLMGACAGFCLSTRPQDAALILSGACVYFLYAIFRRKISWRTLVGAAVPFAFVCGLTLVVLRLQIGQWFKTGYDIAPQFYWWTKLNMNIPARDAWKYPIPLMTGAYVFFPMAPAIAVAGLFVLGVRRLTFMLVVGGLAHLVFYILCDFGRYRDFGYGPRYHMPLLIVLAVGMAVALAPLFRAFERRSLELPDLPRKLVPLAPAALVVLAAAAGVVRCSLPVYACGYQPFRSALTRAIQRDNLHNAVVIVGQSATGSGPLIEVRNDPFEANPDVVILSGDELDCTRKLYAGRQFYRATGHDEITLTPF